MCELFLAYIAGSYLPSIMCERRVRNFTQIEWPINLHSKITVDQALCTIQVNPGKTKLSVCGQCEDTFRYTQFNIMDITYYK